MFNLRYCSRDVCMAKLRHCCWLFEQKPNTLVVVKKGLFENVHAVVWGVCTYERGIVFPHLFKRSCNVANVLATGAVRG